MHVICVLSNIQVKLSDSNAVKNLYLPITSAAEKFCQKNMLCIV